MANGPAKDELKAITSPISGGKTGVRVAAAERVPLPPEVSGV